uniref:Uncharacterized protein n=1 Tax=Gossypium raimondii TaxID=29730 RepID=A0A0D2T5V4_GOSRA|nr:hypothetical protein B456_008G240200 [Gossypium raimondii]
MSEKSLRRRLPRCRRPRIPHPSPTPRLRTPPPHRRSLRRSSKYDRILKRCASEPCLWSSIGEDHPSRSSFVGSEAERAPFFRPHTCTDVFASSPSLLGFCSPSPSPSPKQGFEVCSLVKLVAVCSFTLLLLKFAVYILIKSFMLVTQS